MKSNEKAAVTIIEATFVFPIMFFIIFFMLMLGSIYFQQARIERIVTEYAIGTAARFENPMLDGISDNGGNVPTATNAVSIKPYRYLFSGHAKSICKEEQGEMLEEIESFGSLGFAGMEAKNVRGSIEPKVFLFLSSVTASCSYRVEFPIKMIFTEKTIGFNFSVTVKQPVSDPAEFIRTVSTVQDLMQRSEELTKMKEKINKVIDKVMPYVN